MSSDLLYLSLLDGPFLKLPDLVLNQNSTPLNQVQPPNYYQLLLRNQTCPDFGPVYQYQSINCNFLGNFGSNLLTLQATLTINIVISLLASLSRKVGRRESRLTSVMQTIDDKFGIPFSLPIIFSNFKPLALYSFVNLISGNSIQMLPAGKIYSVAFFAVLGGSLLATWFNSESYLFHRKVRDGGKSASEDSEGKKVVSYFYSDHSLEKSGFRKRLPFKYLIFLYEEYRTRLSPLGPCLPILKYFIISLEAISIALLAGKGIPQLAVYASLELIMLFLVIKSNVKVSKVAQAVDVLNSLVAVLFAGVKMITFADLSVGARQNAVGGLMFGLLVLLVVANLGYAIIMFLILLYQLLKKSYCADKKVVGNASRAAQTSTSGTTCRTSCGTETITILGHIRAVETDRAVVGASETAIAARGVAAKTDSTSSQEVVQSTSCTARTCTSRAANWTSCRTETIDILGDVCAVGTSRTVVSGTEASVAGCGIALRAVIVNPTWTEEVISDA